MDPDRPDSDAAPTIQDRLERLDDDRVDDRAGRPATIDDPVALLQHLDDSGQFHRDSRIGRLFHRGMVSLRETVATDSLHVSVDGNRLTAHIDGVSPLKLRADGTSVYSLRRTLVHNLAGMTHDLLWLLRGRQGDHRCELNCQWLRSDAEPAGEVELLDPSTGAWSVQMDARIAGSFDEARLRGAIRAALGCDDAGWLRVTDCGDDAALAAARAALQNAAVPADAHPPLRACLARHPDGDVLMLGLNHAAGDGFATLQVLRSIARAYAGGHAGPPLDFIATRDLPVRPAATFASPTARAYRKAAPRLHDMRDRPARLAEDEPGDDPGCGYHLVALSAQDTNRVLDARHDRRDADVLLTALHLAIGDWNERHDAGGGRIGVLVQADLRPSHWRDAPIGNFSVIARISTTPADRESPSSAMSTISAEVERNKRMRTGVALMAALDRANLLELWAKQSIVVIAPVTTNHLVDTTVLSSLGHQEAPSFGPDAGPTTELWFSAPARAPRSLSLGVVIVDGRLHLTFRYPQRVFGPHAARRFADCYVEHLRLVGAAVEGM